jgi:hypothetical protein
MCCCFLLLLELLVDVHRTLQLKLNHLSITFQPLQFLTPSSSVVYATARLVVVPPEMVVFRDVYSRVKLVLLAGTTCYQSSIQ